MPCDGRAILCARDGLVERSPNSWCEQTYGLEDESEFQNILSDTSHLKRITRKMSPNLPDLSTITV